MDALFRVTSETGSCSSENGGQASSREGNTALRQARNGRVFINRSESGEALDLIQAGGPPVKRGSETNSLRIVAVGSQIALYVNRAPALYTDEPGYTERFKTGRIKLLVCRKGVTPLRVHYGNLKTWDIPDLPLPNQHLPREQRQRRASGGAVHPWLVVPLVLAAVRQGATHFLSASHLSFSTLRPIPPILCPLRSIDRPSAQCYNKNETKRGIGYDEQLPVNLPPGYYKRRTRTS
jgi:hypothetical protein